MINQERALKELKKKVLTLGARVEENVRQSIVSVERHDEVLAQRVFLGDADIDHMEVDVEEECLKILALYQPVAVDLRFIVAVLKINNDLERIGDVAVNISERAVYLATHTPLSQQYDFRPMAAKTEEMLKLSLDSLVERDETIARKVCAMDDIVDAHNRDAYEHVQESIRKFPEDLVGLIHVLAVARHLERIADLATNIAEDVIYMVKGEIVRHRMEDFSSRA